MGQSQPRAGAPGTPPPPKPVLSWMVALQQPIPATVQTFEQSRDPKDYAASGFNGMRWVRFPGQVHDQRINIDSCTNCQFFLVDQLDSVQIDECISCGMGNWKDLRRLVKRRAPDGQLVRLDESC